MTAFLQRLARRAAGTASAVRSLSRPRLGAAPEDPPSTDGATPRGGWIDHPLRPDPGLTQTPPHGVGGAPTDAPGERAQAPTHAHLLRATGPAVTPTDRRRPPSQLMSQESVVPTPGAPRTDRPVHGAAALADTHGTAPSPPPDPLGPLPAARPPTTAQGIRPTPLLPPVQAPTPRPADPWSTAVPSGARTGGRAANSEPAEVHVTIGRIEVTAVHEPAATPKTAARRHAPMSLDEYLAQRRGGRP